MVTTAIPRLRCLAPTPLDGDPSGRLPAALSARWVAAPPPLPGGTSPLPPDAGDFVGYRVGDAVTAHEAHGAGVYHFFRDHPVAVRRGIAAPARPGVRFVSPLAVYLSGFGAGPLLPQWESILPQTSDCRTLTRGGRKHTCFFDFEKNFSFCLLLAIWQLFAFLFSGDFLSSAGKQCRFCLFLDQAAFLDQILS